jgi:peptidoglycan/xylan/chitin deacetylase (PgdA/CDA1 family)
VALTFDDGPGPYTHFALKKLRRFRARATFFLVGRNISRFPGLPPREVRFGPLGDHSFTHPFLPGLPIPAMKAEVARTARAVSAAGGSRVVLFRPPYGARNPAIDAEARSLGLLEVIWDVDSLDSRGANYAGITANVERGLRPGAIVLMHENRGQTIRALPAIFGALRRRHLHAVTLPELLKHDPPSPRQLRRGPRGCPGL